MNELPGTFQAVLQFGAFGLLSIVLYWVGKYMVDRFSSRFDQLESKMEEERKSNVKLGKMILLAALKFKNPTADISDEANQLFHDDDKDK